MVTDPSSRHVRWTISWCTAASIAATAVALLVPGPLIGPWFMVAAMAGAFFAAEVATTDVRHGAESESFSISDVPLAIGLLVLGPLGLIAGRLVGSALALVVAHHQHGEKLVFNLAMWSCQAAVASAVMAVFAGQDRTSARGAYALLLAIAITDAMAAVAINDIIAKVRGEARTIGALVNTVRAGLPPALAAAAFAFVLVRTVSGDWMLAGPLTMIGLSIWLAFRTETSLLTERDGLRRVASLGSVVLHPELDETTSIRTLLTAVAALLHSDVIGLQVTEPTGDRVVFTTDDRAHMLLAGLAEVDEPRVLTVQECAGTVRDGLLVPLSRDAPVTGRLLVADSVGEAAVLGSADLRVAVTLAGQLATMVHNARLNGTVREQAKRARWEARHDPLTSLPNRLWLGEHLQQQPVDAPYSILLLDLDGFKAVNDALGHTSGDDLLVDFARRMRHMVPDDVIATRFAGDEFVCLVPGPSERGMAIAHAAREHFQTASSIRGMRLSVMPSIGLAHHPTDGTDSEELMRAADVAMYRAKRDGSGVSRFVIDDAEAAARQLRLAVDLRDAISGEHLTCAYQPVIGLRDASISHFEALARWHHPVLGPVSPEEFIPLAEGSGLIRDLTMHVVRQAARSCCRWLADGVDAGVAVNLAPQSLSDSSMPSAIRAILAEEGLDPRRLSVEITETTLLTDAGRALSLLAEFEAVGIGVAIDDFGTGYSSLAYLGRIPVDVLKVDRSLVSNRGDARGSTILRAVIDLAAGLGLTVVAEGIETREDYEWLRDIGCALGQGYFMAKPLAEEHLTDWVSSWATTAQGLRVPPLRHLSALVL